MTIEVLFGVVPDWLMSSSGRDDGGYGYSYGSGYGFGDGDASGYGYGDGDGLSYGYGGGYVDGSGEVPHNDDD